MVYPFFLPYDFAMAARSRAEAMKTAKLDWSTFPTSARSGAFGGMRPDGILPVISST